MCEDLLKLLIRSTYLVLSDALRSGFKNINTCKSLPTWTELAPNWMFVCGLCIHNLWLNPQSSLQTRGFVEQRSPDSSV